MDIIEKIKLFGKEFNVLIWKGYKHREEYACNFTRNKEGCKVTAVKGVNGIQPTMQFEVYSNKR